MLILERQRYKVPLDAAPNAVPDFVDNENWYTYVRPIFVVSVRVAGLS